MLNKAKARVNETDELSIYEDILIDYQWQNQEEHFEWVATAPLEEIIDWAEDIRRNELAQIDEAIRVNNLPDGDEDTDTQYSDYP